MQHRSRKPTVKVVKREKRKGLSPFDRKELSSQPGLGNFTNIVCTFDTVKEIGTGGSTVAAWRLSPNNLYDVDPAFGSTSAIGFTEFAAFFTFYLVKSYDVEVIVANNDVNTATLFFVHLNQDPGTTYNTTYQSGIYQEFGFRRDLAVYGNTTFTYRKKVNVSKLVGIPITQRDSFSSNSSTAPSNIVFFGMSAIAANPALSLTSGLSCKIAVRMHVHMWERRILVPGVFYTRTDEEKVQYALSVKQRAEDRNTRFPGTHQMEWYELDQITRNIQKLLPRIDPVEQETQEIEKLKQKLQQDLLQILPPS